MKFSKILSYIIFSLTIFYALSSHTFAQLSNNSLSIGFAPTSQSLTIQPGKTYKGEFTIWNLAPITKTFNISIRGFQQIENYPGTARILTDEEEERDVYSAADWFKIPFEKVFLVSNQYTKIPYEITVPKEAASGEYHAMIFLLSQTDERFLDISGAESPLGVGPVFLIKVGDEIVQKAEIEYFKAEKTFYELPPVTFLTRYVNKGNSHITPAGDIIISNFLGQEIDKVTFNENRQSLIRGNAANYTDEWDHDGIFFTDGKLAIGPMKARLITTYLSDNPGYAPLSAITEFWVLPWKHILAILAIVGIIYKSISYLSKKYGKNKEEKPPVSPTFNYPRYA